MHFEQLSDRWHHGASPAASDEPAEPAAPNDVGSILTCANTDCGCRLRIEEPCPHGDGYTCACGHPFVPAGAAPLRDLPG